MDKLMRRKIRSGSLRDALAVVNGMEDTTAILVPVILRDHLGIFNAALLRAQEVPPICMKHLLNKPKMLRLALSRGLDPNVTIDGISAVEMAAKKHLYGSLKELLSLDDIRVSRYVLNKVKTKAELYMLALRHMEPTRLDVIYALQIRSTPLLQLCLDKLTETVPDLSSMDIDGEEDDEEKQKREQRAANAEWASKVIDILQCPILLRPTAEPVKAPSGHIYDQSCIYDWVATNRTNPMTRQPLNKSDLVTVGATVLGPELLEGI